MYCMTVSYAKLESTHFDIDYFLNEHIPLVKESFETFGLVGITVKAGLGSVPSKEDLFYLSVDIVFDSLEAMKTATSTAGKYVGNDVKNYTDVKPQYQFGEYIKILSFHHLE